MEAFISKSLEQGLTDYEFERMGVRVTSFMSFYRAIEETLPIGKTMDDVKGYRVTNQGIEIVWKQ